MTALTVWQPWAFWLVAGVKTAENRGWALPSRFRGVRLAIHAGRVYDTEWRTRLTAPFPPFGDPALMPRSAVVGSVIFDRDCRGCDDPWCESRRQPLSIGWHVRPGSAIALVDPVPCPGRLGLWPLSPNVERAVRAQMGEAA